MCCSALMFKPRSGVKVSLKPFQRLAERETASRGLKPAQPKEKASEAGARAVGDSPLSGPTPGTSPSPRGSKTGAAGKKQRAERTSPKGCSSASGPLIETAKGHLSSYTRMSFFPFPQQGRALAYLPAAACGLRHCFSFSASPLRSWSSAPHLASFLKKAGPKTFTLPASSSRRFCARSSPGAFAVPQCPPARGPGALQKCGAALPGSRPPAPPGRNTA